MTKHGIILPKWINEFKPQNVIVLSPEDVLFAFQNKIGRNPTKEEFEKCFYLSKKYLDSDMDRFWECVEMAVDEVNA